MQLRTRVKKLEDENESAKANVSALTKDLDHLTLSHSQILVENTKLTNDKLRLEQEIRKMENRCDMSVRSMHDKFTKEVRSIVVSRFFFSLQSTHPFAKSFCKIVLTNRPRVFITDIGLESSQRVTEGKIARVGGYEQGATKARRGLRGERLGAKLQRRFFDTGGDYAEANLRRHHARISSV